MLRPFCLLPAATALLLAASLAHAQTFPTPSAPTPPKSDPAAIALLTQMCHAYQNLRTYSGTETTTGPANMGMPYRLTLTYARPDRVNLLVTRSAGGGPPTLQLVCDGTHSFAFNSQQPKRYLKTIAAKTPSVLEGAMQSADIKMAMTALFLEQGDDMLKSLTAPQNGAQMTLGKPDRLDGVAVDTVLVMAERPGYHSSGAFQIGHADHLLRRFDSTDENQGQPPMTFTETFTQVQANPALTAAAFVFVPPPGAATVDPPVSVKSDPAAVALMTRMYAAYSALHSFSCTAQSADSSPARTSHASAVYQFQKPNKIAFSRTNEFGAAQAVSDGKTLYAISDENKGGTEDWRAHPPYLKIPAPNTSIPWNDALVLARFGNLPSYGGGSGADFMPEVVLGIDFLPADGDYGFQLGTPTVLNGEPVDIVFRREQSVYEGGVPDGSVGMSTLWISKIDHLLRQVQEEWTRPEGVTRRTETYGEVKANPDLPVSVFTFTPPANGRAVDTPDALVPPRVAVGPTLHVGDPAPAAVFGRASLAGRPVTAADYAGKVILLDFWATWCGPCRKQIPGTVAAYRKYHTQGLDIVGYALEQRKDLPKLPAFTAANSMSWPEIWDKDGVLANAVAAQGIPYVIIVGRDGKIAALGNPGDNIDVIAAIEAALAKP